MDTSMATIMICYLIQRTDNIAEACNNYFRSYHSWTGRKKTFPVKFRELLIYLNTMKNDIHNII